MASLDVLSKWGGPAFPSETSCSDGSEYFFPGMSLRDYFAAQALAMAGIVLSKRQQDAFTDATDEEGIAILAKTTYEIADAMLAAREGKP